LGGAVARANDVGNFHEAMPPFFRISCVMGLKL